jgi:formate dehydrogenase maturation protein FdhE
MGLKDETMKNIKSKCSNCHGTGDSEAYFYNGVQQSSGYRHCSSCNGTGDALYSEKENATEEIIKALRKFLDIHKDKINLMDGLVGLKYYINILDELEK